MDKESSNLELRHISIVGLLKKHNYEMSSVSNEFGGRSQKKKNKKELKKLLKQFETEVSGNFSATIVFSNPDTGGKRVYSGETKNGKPHGQGIDEYIDEGYKIKGEFRNGDANGQSTITWSDGSMYEGQVIDGVKSGSGTFTHPDGISDDGEWLNDKPIRLKRYKNGKIIGKHFFLRNGGSSSIDDKFLTISEYKKKNPKNKSLNN